MWGNIPLYQQIKKRANDLDIIILSEANQGRETQIHGITSMWNLKYVTRELIYKTEIVFIFHIGKMWKICTSWWCKRDISEKKNDAGEVRQERRG